MPNMILKPFHAVQNTVDSISMYRLVSGTLLGLAALSIGAGFFNLLVHSGLSQIFSLSLALITALSTNWFIATVTKISVNHESAVITALIMFFLIMPQGNVLDTWPLALATAIAVLSKFILVYKKQHLFNPAAFGLAALGFAGIHASSWWVANPILFIPLLMGGILVVMKVRKWPMILSFVAASFVLYIVDVFAYGDPLAPAVPIFFISWPILFLVFYMLTEPFTTPAMKNQQILYATIVAFLAMSPLASTFFSFTPELALVMASAVMLPARLSQKLFLSYESKRLIAKDVYEFVFKKPEGFTFRAGQYLEWMLPQESADKRGIRRYFSIASAPTEKNIMMACKIHAKGSSYKKALMQLDVGDKIIASQLAGDFVIEEAEDKLGFIAGGIGITPFRSQIKDMVDTGKMHDTKLLYCVNEISELAYEAEFESAIARQLPLEMIAVIAKAKENDAESASAKKHSPLEVSAEQGFITLEMISRRVPDFLERTWYISGPPPMVSAYRRLLKKAGVPGKQIKTDFFPGAT